MKLDHTMVSVAKRNNVDAAFQIVHRLILGEHFTGIRALWNPDSGPVRRKPDTLAVAACAGEARGIDRV